MNTLLVQPRHGADSRTLPAGLIRAAREIATQTAAVHAKDVDERARFPEESVRAFRSAGLLAAPIPTAFGGPGCHLRELAEICAAVSQGCASSGMVLAMHYIQVACIARHHGESRLFLGFMRESVKAQPLLASITSEVGTSGETRASVCAIESVDDRFSLLKNATTGSYALHADGILVTSRRSSEAPASDQVLTLVRKGEYELEQTTDWDTLGMRGTCSPGFRLRASGPTDAILPVPFAECSALTMVPYSHVLWSAVWWGIAADALARAASFVRTEARKKPGEVPLSAHRLAAASAALQEIRYFWSGVADEFDSAAQDAASSEQLAGIGWALRCNNLKTAVSEAAPRLVQEALQIVGLLGYKNNSPFSVGRQLRDALSASLMISNDRIRAKSASMLLVYKDQ